MVAITGTRRVDSDSGWRWMNGGVTAAGLINNAGTRQKIEDNLNTRVLVVVVCECLFLSKRLRFDIATELLSDIRKWRWAGVIGKYSLYSSPTSVSQGWGYGGRVAWGECEGTRQSYLIQ